MGENDREIFNRLAEIEKIVARIDERTQQWAQQREDIEKRVRNLEEQNARRGGVMTALTAIGSAIGAALTWFVQHMIGGAQ